MTYAPGIIIISTTNKNSVMKDQQISLADIANNSVLKKQIFKLLQNPGKTDNAFLLALVNPHRYKKSSHKWDLSIARSAFSSSFNGISITFKYTLERRTAVEVFTISDDLDLSRTYNFLVISVKGMVEFYNTLITHYNNVTAGEVKTNWLNSVN